MTKQELVKKLYYATSLTMLQADEAVEAIRDIMCEAFAQGESIYLRGLGTFKVLQRKEKVARDIKRRKPIVIPPRKTVKFIPSASLKKQLLK